MKYQPTGKPGFDRSVEDLADQLRVRVTSEPFASDDYQRPKESTPASLNTKRVLAQHILKVYGNRPDLVNKVVDDFELQIFISTAKDKDAAGLAVGG